MFSFGQKRINLKYTLPVTIFISILTMMLWLKEGQEIHNKHIEV